MQSMPPRQFPKLPFSLIDDHAPSGSLYDIIMKAFQLKEAKNMKALEWRNPQQRMVLVGILGTVRSTLAKNGYAITPVILLDESLPQQERDELTNMIESLKGRVVTDRNAVGLTHIVYPFGPDGDPDDGEEYMRVRIWSRAVHTTIRAACSLRVWQQCSHPFWLHRGLAWSAFSNLPQLDLCLGAYCRCSGCAAIRRWCTDGTPPTATTSG